MADVKGIALGWFASVLIPGLIGALGGWDKALQGLCAFIVLDLVAGELARLFTKEKFCWDKGFQGSLKKIMYFVVISAANYMDTSFGISGIRPAMIIYFSALEASSILRHAALCSIPIPNWVGMAIDQVIAKIRKGKPFSDCDKEEDAK